MRRKALTAPVDRLSDESRWLIEQPLPEGAGQGRLAELLQGWSTQRRTAITALKSGWARRALEMKAWLDRQLAVASCPFDRRKLQSRNYTSWLNALAAWAEDPDAERPDMKKGAIRPRPRA
jgi:exodeoxyribonuclease V beta subunit